MTAHRVESSLRCLNSYAQDFVSHLVVHPPAVFKLHFQNAPLTFGEVDSVFEGFSHMSSILEIV